MIFGTLNPEKISHEILTDLCISPVRCSHFTLGNPTKSFSTYLHSYILSDDRGGSVAECWTDAQKARVQIVATTLSGNSLRQTAHTHRASVHQPAKLVAALLRVTGVTAGLAESKGSLPPGL